MGSINSVAISGNLGMAADRKEGASGGTAVSFSVAVNERERNRRTGEWEDRANWIRCVMFGNYATAMHPHLAKGALVFVQGRLHTVKWCDNAGTSHTFTEMIVENIDVSSPRASRAAPADAYAASMGYESTTPPPSVIGQVNASLFDE